MAMLSRSAGKASRRALKRFESEGVMVAGVAGSGPELGASFFDEGRHALAVLDAGGVAEVGAALFRRRPARGKLAQCALVDARGLRRQRGGGPRALQRLHGDLVVGGDRMHEAE